MELNTVTCDVCGALKKEANHWWKGYLIETDENKPVGVLIVPVYLGRVIWPFFRQELPRPSVHLCGEDHAQQWQSKELAKISAAAIRDVVAKATAPAPVSSPKWVTTAHIQA